LQSDNAKRNKKIKYFLIAVASALLIFLLFFKILSSKNITTDNAYTAVDDAQITSPISAIVMSVLVSDTDFVKEGDAIVKFDPVDLELDLKQIEYEFVQSEHSYLQIKDDYLRRKILKNNSVSQEEIKHAESKLRVAEASLMNLKAKLDQAKINLSKTTIRAPISGIIAKTDVKIGQNVLKGTKILSIIPVDKIYVNANFKESQLKDIKIGNKVIMTSDLYGSSVKYQGTVAGISAGTGSVFSIIPAQNATGNWIKVIQRVPVKITINKEDLLKNPLLIGLSMNVAVKVDDK
jgi:membrane fusion protein, multidrug efflux system